MKQIKSIQLGVFFLIIISACQPEAPNLPAPQVYFDFSFNDAINGNITSSDSLNASLDCANGRNILTFKENIGELPKDSLAGELILAFQEGDTIGTFSLKGITEKRDTSTVGIVTLLDEFFFDEMAAQHISNINRYQRVLSGEVTISSWGTNVGEWISGTLSATLKHTTNIHQNIQLEGHFNIQITPDMEFCD